jgi:biopolymer transport protein ExbD
MRIERANRGLGLVPPTGRPPAAEGLIPLINVIFLILIFFMIAGHMEAPGPLRVDPPDSSTDSGPVAAGLTLLLAADGQVAAGEAVLSRDALGPWLQRWAASAAVTAPDVPLPLVTLKADGGLASHRLRSILASLRRAGFHRVTLVTERGP